MDISLPISFSRGGLGEGVDSLGEGVDSPSEGEDTIPLVRVEKLFFLDSPSEGEDTIPLVRVEFFFSGLGHADM